MNLVGNLLFLGSASVQFLYSEPRNFANKVLEKARQSNCPLPQMLGDYLRREDEIDLGDFRGLARVGELAASAQLVADSDRLPSLRDIRSAKRILERSRRLQTDILFNGRGASSDGEKSRPLFVLNNCVPFTQSGYTQRSQETLLALNNLGVESSAITRFGYPIVVGSMPANDAVIVNGVQYRLILPNVYPRSLRKRDELAVRAIVQEAKKTEATVIHTTTDFRNAQLVSRAARDLGVPWVYEVRGEPHMTWLSRIPSQLRDTARHSEYFKLAEAQEARAMSAADAVVALSNISKQRMVERGIDGKKIYVVPNAVKQDILDKNISKMEARKQLHLPEGAIVGAATSVVGYEGLDDLVKAAKFDSTFRVLIVGDGIERPNLENLAVDLGVQDRVTFVGRKPSSEVWKWYAAMDVFVIPRKDHEVCRLVTPVKGLTAQALGIPVVASDLPALREITGELATYTEPENPRSLAEGIHRALISGNSASGQQASRAWAASHTWGANAVVYQQLYSNL